MMSRKDEKRRNQHNAKGRTKRLRAAKKAQKCSEKRTKRAGQKREKEPAPYSLSTLVEAFGRED